MSVRLEFSSRTVRGRSSCEGQAQAHPAEGHSQLRQTAYDRNLAYE